jgi:hypothetical protein
MEAPIVCEGSARVNDAFDMLLLHVKPRPAFAILGSAMVVLAVAACFLPQRTPDGHTGSPSIGLPVALAFLALYAFVYVPWNVRRLFRQNPLRNMSCRYEVADTGLTLKSERGETRFLWSDFRRWRSNRKVLLLYLTDASFIGLPARLFRSHDKYLDLQGLVARHVGKSA